MENITSDEVGDLIASKSINIEDCKRVCLTLGPYRNLTTLTASALFLHPNCQVLNHAKKRIYENSEVDFLSNYSRERFNRFVQYAIQISGGGKRGAYGGSIIHSHAFDSQHEMSKLFHETGGNLIKGKIHCLFWKESLETSNLIREKEIDLGNIFLKEERLVFLMPIRNPLDCAVSNLNTGHFRRFRGINTNPSVQEILLAVLDEIHWFFSLEKNFQGRFFHYFEHSINPEMLFQLASFLELRADETWMSNTLRVMVNKSIYQHDSSLVDFYRKSVESVFSKEPYMTEQLLKYTHGL